MLANFYGVDIRYATDLKVLHSGQTVLGVGWIRIMRDEGLLCSYDALWLLVRTIATDLNVLDMDKHLMNSDLQPICERKMEQCDICNEQPLKLLTSDKLESMPLHK